ncbi:MAG: SGNH/GDSL hydrolase family protein [Bacteroidales bacterium]|jgi:lysophospholipase L1-like esterase
MRHLKLTIGLLLLSIFTATLLQAQDWAQLGHYRSDNIKLGPPKPGEKRVVFMGNSITDYWNRFLPGFFIGRPYINRGISGQTSPQMLVRFRADVISLKPVAVVILAGTNDIAGNTGPSTIEMIMDNISSMTEIARANGIKVVLCSVLPAYQYFWKPQVHPAESIVALNDMIKAYASKNKIVYVDYYSSMVDERKGLKTEYTNDGVHPNEAGYQVMVPLVEAGIAKALAPK